MIKMVKRAAVILIIVFLAAGAIAAIFWSVSSQPVSVKVIQMELSALHNVVNTNGRVEASNVYEIRAPFAGVCTRVLAGNGRELTAGQPIVSFDDSAIRSDLAGARAELNAAQVDLRNVRRGPAPEELNPADAEIARLTLQLQGAKTTLESNQWLYQRNAIAKAELDQSQREVAQLEQSLQAAKTRVVDLKSRFTEEDYKRAVSRVDAAQSRIALLESNQARAIVRCPVRGTIYRFSIREGAYVNAGDLIAYVSDFSHLRVRAYVDEPDLGQISRGAEVLIRWNAHPESTWKGTVQEIPPEVVRLETRSVAEVLCSIDSPRLSLIPNINVDVELASSPGPKVTSLPRSVVFTDGENQFVWLVREGRTEKHPVRTGQSTSTRIEITGGLSPGDKVIVPGDVPITEGMRVQVVGE